MESRPCSVVPERDAHLDCVLSFPLAWSIMPDPNDADFRFGQLLGLAAGLAAVVVLQVLLFIFL